MNSRYKFGWTNQKSMRPVHIKIITIIVLLNLCILSCKKQTLGSQDANGLQLSSSVQAQHARITYPFSMQSTGPFTISPVSPTIVKINQQLSISASSPFILTAGIVTGYDDLTIPTFPERFFDGSFKLYGQGNDSLFAIVTVQTSVFSDPIDPQAGDFVGSEDFNGTIIITGGTGHYLHATGTGTYTAHSEWRPPVQAGTLFSGYTTVNGTGSVAVLARNGKLESN